MSAPRLVFLAALLGACPAVFAFDTWTNYEGGTTRFDRVRVTAADAITSAQNSAKAAGRVSFTGPAGASIAADMEATIARRALFTMSARAFAYALPAVGVAWLAYDVWQSVRTMGDGLGNLNFDPGVVPTTETAVCYRGSLGVGSPSQSPNCIIDRVASVSADGQWWVSHSTWSGRAEYVGNVTCPPGTGAIRCTFYYHEWSANGSDLGIKSKDSVTTPVTGPHTFCPGFTDSYTGHVWPSGSWDPGFDGKCPTGDYTVPTTPGETADKAANSPKLPPHDPDDLLNDLVQRGGGGIDLPKADPDITYGVINLTPGYVPGGKVTTQTQTGSTVSESRWKFQQLGGLSPDGQWSEETTTTDYDLNGDVVGVPRTETKEPAPADPKDPCTGNPDRVGCVNLGQVEDTELGKRDVSVSWSPQSGWGADTAACPAPRVVSVLGQTVTIDNSLLCEFMSGIRFALVGVAGIVGALIFVGGLRQ